MLSISQRKTAPISAAVRAALRNDTTRIREVAHRKEVLIDDFSERRELRAAREHFELGCWLYYYSRRVSIPGPDGLAARIDCAKRIFLAGITNPYYDFFTIFDFGERQFDTIFEMGDSEEVIAALRTEIPKDQTGRLADAFRNYGWSLPQHLLQQAA